MAILVPFITGLVKGKCFINNSIIDIATIFTGPVLLYDGVKKLRKLNIIQLADEQNESGNSNEIITTKESAYTKCNNFLIASFYTSVGVALFVDAITNLPKCAINHTSIELAAMPFVICTEFLLTYCFINRAIKRFNKLLKMKKAQHGMR